MRICEHYVTVTQKLAFLTVFAAGLLDKANPFLYSIYRGAGLEEGMKIFQNSSRHLA